jgi:hypothetical protein
MGGVVMIAVAALLPTIVNWNIDRRVDSIVVLDSAVDDDNYEKWLVLPGPTRRPLHSHATGWGLIVPPPPPPPG